MNKVWVLAPRQLSQLLQQSHPPVHSVSEFPFWVATLIIPKASLPIKKPPKGQLNLVSRVGLLESFLEHLVRSHRAKVLTYNTIGICSAVADTSTSPLSTLEEGPVDRMHFI